MNDSSRASYSGNQGKPKPDCESNPSGRRVSSPIRWLVLVGGLLFVVAPWFTAVETKTTDGAAGTYPGWPLLFFGWISTLNILDGRIDAIGWLANPFFVLGTLMFLTRHTKITFALLASAACFAAMSYFLEEVPLDEGGNTAMVVRFSVGFWLWTSAIWINFLVATISLVLTAKSSPRENRPAIY